MIKRIAILLLTALASASNNKLDAAETSYDVVVYGGTCAAVTAAVQVKKMGKTVVIVSPDKHLGGLSSGGLGWTDSGNKSVIGGLSREFYHRIWMHYEKPEAWVQQKRADYGNKGQGTEAIDATSGTMWIFEPHVAEEVFDGWVKELDIPVVREALLDRAKGVQKMGDKLTSITTLDGTTYAGRMFIDATYEGDLMAAAGVDYHVGREANAEYGEEHNGIQVGVLHHKHHFGAVDQPISPYKVPGDPNSGVLPRVSTAPVGEFGQGDKRVQAYCFRSCYTNDPSNRIPFPKPEGYDPEQYEILLRVLNAGWKEFFGKFDPIPNHKTDTNNHGPFSFDNIGYNYDYPEASYERRREIIAEHRLYQQGLMWFVANDPRVPKDVQDELREWGLPKDEFTDNGNWSHQLYIREARRMIGKFVMTENELRKMKPTPESVGMGSYTIDSHNVQRYITPEGYVQNEGDIGVSTGGPYEIAYGSLVPKEGQGFNLVVPVAMSASHIAYGSIRMEPVFMILGQSAATAAVLADEAGLSVQALSYDTLKARLVADGQILQAPKGVTPAGVKLDGIVIDDQDALKKGHWSSGSFAKTAVNGGYQHDGNQSKGEVSATFTTKLKPGKYEVRFAYVPNNNRADNVPVVVRHAGGATTVTVNEKLKPQLDGVSVSLGVFDFGAEGSVEVSNAGTSGHVIIDGVQWLAQ
jgi:hypothetical protein